MLDARRGLFRENSQQYSRLGVTMANANRFVGNFVGNALLSFLVAGVVIAFLTTLLSWSAFWYIPTTLSLPFHPSNLPPLYPSAVLP